MSREEERNGNEQRAENQSPMSPREEEIAAYLEGDLDAVADFERRMKSDERLRDEVEERRLAMNAVSDWMEAPSPGAERAENLALPETVARSVPEPVRPTRAREAAEPPHTAWSATVHTIRIRRLFAVAAIFLGGFVIGHLTGRPTVEPGSETGQPGEAVSQTTPQQSPTAVIEPTPAPTPRPASDEVEPRESERPELAGLSQTHYSTDERGRLVIETRSPETNASIFWVVDSEFQVASNRNKRSEQ